MGRMMLRKRRNSLKHVRWSFRYSGWLRSDRTSAPPIRCVQFDVSPGRARLSAFATHSSRPGQFTLEFAGTAVRRRCEIARREDYYFSVRSLKSGKVCDTVA